MSIVYHTLPKIFALSISVILIGCGSGSSEQHDDERLDNPPNNTCTSSQYLEEGICKNKLTQTIQYPEIQKLIKGQAYQLSLQTNQNLAVELSSTSPNTCHIINGEVKAIELGKCTLQFTQAGTTQILPLERQITLDVISPDSEATQNLSACQAGKLDDTARQIFLKTVNEIRALHQLSTLEYDYEHEDQVMQAAMVLAVNKQISHYPTASWKCFTDIAYQGTTTSNLNLVTSNGSLKNYGTATHVIDWMTEENSANLGHRRNILNPFLSKVSYAEILDMQNPSLGSTLAAAMKVVYADITTTTANKGVIAYPYHDYPVKYFLKSEPLSLSILDNPTDEYANSKVDFSKASLVVTRRDNGQIQNIQNIQYDNIYTGLPNNLQFNVPTLEHHVIYDVKVSNVIIGDAVKDYTYWFRIVD
ncbi:MAG: CAP domain-containing protein [Acinetobacter sp.]|jgi:uncharacterized protein YkwD|nr:MAG: CAP domain-containing protein [Acinetobacter sp.]